MLNCLTLLSIDLIKEGYVRPAEAIAEALSRGWIEPVIRDDELLIEVTELGRKRAGELVRSYS